MCENTMYVSSSWRSTLVKYVQVQKIISYIQPSCTVLRSSCGVQVNYHYYNAIGVFYLKTPHEYDLVARSRQIEMQLVLAVTWNPLNSYIRAPLH